MPSRMNWREMNQISKAASEDNVEYNLVEIESMLDEKLQAGWLADEDLVDGAEGARAREEVVRLHRVDIQIFAQEI